MQHENATRTSRRMLYLPLVGLLLVAVGWSGIWFYGKHRIEQELDSFFIRQAAVGRAWQCPDRSISGYPFRIELRCKQPTFTTDTNTGRPIRGSLGALTVIATTAGALDLAHIIGEFEGPLVAAEAGIGTTTTTWKTARASFRGHAKRLERLSVEVDAPRSTFELQGEQSLTVSADSLAFHLREGQTPNQPDAYDASLKLVKAVIPPLDIVSNSNDPADIELDARVLKLAAFDRRDWRKTVEDWRANGGTVLVEQLKLTKGAPRLEAKGTLKLDDTRRMEGRLEASFVNADALLRQFGIGGGGGGLLGALLGGGRPQAGNDPQRAERVMRLPLVLDNGRVRVGPFAIPGLFLRPVF
ncbi:MAG: DUF2125 domain-containing protein [Beijerinckiaceae bacterium]